MEPQSERLPELADLMASYGTAMIRIQQLERELADLRGTVTTGFGGHSEGSLVTNQLKTSQEHLKAQTDLNTTLRVQVNRLNSQLEEAIGPATRNLSGRPRRRSKRQSHRWWKFWQRSEKRKSQQSPKD